MSRRAAYVVAALVLGAEALALAAAAATAGCTYDFDKFVGDGAVPPQPDGNGGDSSPQGDGTGGGDGGGMDAAMDAPTDGGGGDGNCTPSASCLATSTTCGNGCSSAYMQCTGGCMGNPGCKTKCTSMEQSCYGNCVSNCFDCTNTAGCASFNACENAAHAGD